MKLPQKHCIIFSLVAALLSSSAFAQRQTREESIEKTLKLLKAPVSPSELWDAIKFSLNVGKHDDAVTYLDRLLASDPPPELLLMIRERDAADYFPKLAATPELQTRAVELLRVIERVAQERARDPERIQKFIDYLTRTPQHRTYGIAQLRNAGPFAIPHLLAALRDPTLVEHRMVILQSMQKLDTAALPPLVAALSAPDLSLVSDVVEVLSVLGDADTATHLRYLAESPDVPQPIQSRARSAIEKVLRVPYAELPSAPEMITAQAERYYNHLVDLRATAGGVTLLWRWVPPEGLRAQEVSTSYAEEYFGIGHCRQALSLNGQYEPAQIILLSLAIEKAVERVGIDQTLPEGPGQASAAALTAGPHIVLKVLDRAIKDERYAVALSALRVLAKNGDANMLGGKPGMASPVLQALALPDRRVQFAAAEAILSLRPQQPIAGTSPVVTILAQALGGDETPKALVIDRDTRRGSSLSALVGEAGYESRFVTGAREGFAYAAATSGVDLILIEANIHDPELSSALASFRNDPRTRAIPIAIIGSGDAPRMADDLELSLRAGDVERALGLFHELGSQVTSSELDARAKEAIHEQITESDQVLRRFVNYSQLRPASRVFMTLVLSELDKINRQIKLARPDSSARTELLQECDRLIGRLRSITVRLAATDVVPVYAVSYPGERELAKYELRYPRVKFVGRTESLEVLKLQLASFLPADDSRPLTAAERAEQSRRAAGWLARIARGEIRGLDISPAESAVIAALSHEAIGSEAIVVASHIPSTAAQRALSKLILNESANMTLRIEAARHITQSFRLVGVQLPAEEVAGLKSMLDQGGEPVLHQSIAAIIGAMKPVAAETGDRLRGFATPDFEPVPPAPAPPVGDNSEPQP